MGAALERQERAQGQRLGPACPSASRQLEKAQRLLVPLILRPSTFPCVPQGPANALEWITKIANIYSGTF